MGIRLTNTVYEPKIINGMLKKHKTVAANVNKITFDRIYKIPIKILMIKE